MNIMELDFPEIIRTFLTMSLTGSIIALILFIIKPIIKDRLPKSFQYYIWFVVFIALLLPLSNMIVLPESSISSRQTTPTPIYDTVQWISQTILEKPIHFISFSEIKAKPNNPQNQFISMATVIFIIWLFGAFIFLTSNIICYILFAQQLKKTNVCASSYEIELLNQLSGKGYHPHLYLNSTIHTPFLMGVFHPTIILPDKKYTNTQLQNIFLHELTHLCRYDIAIKWILIFLGAFHWYNPIIYFVRQEIDRACELACDEAVIKNLDLIGKQNYGNTLIEIAANNSSKIPLSITMSEDKKILKRRLNAIMKHTNFSKKAVILPSIFLIITLCGVFYISAVSSIDNTKNKVNIT